MHRAAHSSSQALGGERRQVITEMLDKLRKFKSLARSGHSGLVTPSANLTESP